MSANDDEPQGGEVAAAEADRSPDMGLRQALAVALGEAYGGDRDFYDTFGWDKSPSIRQYYANYLRNPYARAVVDAPAETTWRNGAEVTADEPTGEQGDDVPDAVREFNAAVGDLTDSTRLYHYVERADRLAGIGQFGVMLIGWADGEEQNLASPVDPAAVGRNDPDEAIDWLRPFSQLSVEKVYCGGPDSERWGEPLYYLIDLDDENDADTGGDAGVKTSDLPTPGEAAARGEGGTDTTFGMGEDRSVWVHYSRVIHFADGLLDDEVRSRPRQEPVFNPLTDIEKVLGAAAEAAYRGVDYGVHANVDPEYELEDGGAALENNLRDWYHGLQPWVQTQGVDLETLGGEAPDPSKVIDPYIEAISAEKKIPQSVLKGNETGERATSQDLKNWYGDIAGRQNGYGAHLLRELFDRCINYGVLPSTPAGYTVDFPPLAEESEKETAEVENKRADTVKKLRAAVPGFGAEAAVEYVQTGDIPADKLDSSPPPEPTPPDGGDGGDGTPGVPDDGDGSE